jgi:diaminopimelate epimerase
MATPFIKMNGAGNDFVIFDAREHPLQLNAAQVRALAARDNRITGGCDQLIVMEPAQDADVFMRIYNADGGEVNACGNATRCVGWLVMDEKNVGNARIKTNADLLHCEINLWGAGQHGWKDASGLVTANMGTPGFGWQDIPLSHPVDTAHVPLEIDGLSDPVCVSMGNPHVVFFVPEPDMIQRIEKVGSQLQRHPLFPMGVNVSIAFVTGNPLSGQIHARVWERGVGLTASCGTAACAMKVGAARRNLLSGDKYHTLTLQNPPAAQTLMCRMDKEGRVFLHGPVQVEFEDEVQL